MNYIKHLTGFFDCIIQDRNLNPTHISLYVALFQFWNINRFQNPISITRNDVMRISKIASKATYHKCMRDLNDKGYIEYEPSYNPYKGSLVILVDFSKCLKPVQIKAGITEKNLSNNEQVLNKQQTSSGTSTGTGTEQALVSSINNTNITNKSNIQNVSNLEKLPQIFELEDAIFKNHIAAEKKEKKLREKKKSFSDTQNHAANNQKLLGKTETNPSFEEVQKYFLQQNLPELEAQKFFYYFSSIGWLVGGKTPMVDWTAAAQNWVLNAAKFVVNDKMPDRAKQLNTRSDKNYAEPL